MSVHFHSHCFRKCLCIFFLISKNTFLQPYFNKVLTLMQMKMHKLLNFFFFWGKSVTAELSWNQNRSCENQAACLCLYFTFPLCKLSETRTEIYCMSGILAWSCELITKTWYITGLNILLDYYQVCFLVPEMHLVYKFENITRF